MLHVLWTVTILKCPYIPKVFIYTRAVKMFIISCKKIPPPPHPPAPKVSLHAQLIPPKINIFYSGKSTITFNAERKQK